MEHVSFHHKAEIYTTRSKWLVRFVLDLQTYRRYIDSVTGNLDKLVNNIQEGLVKIREIPQIDKHDTDLVLSLLDVVRYMKTLHEFNVNSFEDETHLGKSFKLTPNKRNELQMLPSVKDIPIGNLVNMIEQQKHATSNVSAMLLYILPPTIIVLLIVIICFICIKKFHVLRNILARSGLIPHDKKCHSVGCSTVHFQSSPAGEENSGNEFGSGGVVTVLSDLAQSATEKCHTKTTMQRAQCVHRLVVLLGASRAVRTTQRYNSSFILCYPNADQEKLCVIPTRIKTKTLCYPSGEQDKNFVLSQRRSR